VFIPRTAIAVRGEIGKISDGNPSLSLRPSNVEFNDGRFMELQALEVSEWQMQPIVAVLVAASTGYCRYKCSLACVDACAAGEEKDRRG
jgi:hypothetical protein